jgi:hypothetical protein
MPRRMSNLTDMEIDEISTVDKAANQYSKFVIAKRAPEEDEMPELYNEEGQLLNEEALEDGDIVYDNDGNAYQFSLEDEDEKQKEAQPVGKSAFFEERPAEQTGTFTASVLEELSKAFSDEDRDKVIAKALGRVEELEAKQNEYAEVAKSERDLRLTREYIAKSAEYNLPVDPQELGPVLYRMAETMSFDDCAVIAKCLESAGNILFEELGYQGGGDNSDILSQVEAQAVEQFGKSDGYNSIEAINKVFDSNPDAYDEYLASQRNR